MAVIVDFYLTCITAYLVCNICDAQLFLCVISYSLYRIVLVYCCTIIMITIIILLYSFGLLLLHSSN